MCSSHAARSSATIDEEDRRRHTVSDDGVVVVTVDDEPFIGPISDERRLEASEAGSGSHAATPDLD